MSLSDSTHCAADHFPWFKTTEFPKEIMSWLQALLLLKCWKRCYPVVPMVYPRTKESQPFHCWEPSPARAWSSRLFAASLSSITAACAACREALLLRHKGILRAALTCGNCAWIKGMMIFFQWWLMAFDSLYHWAQQRACKSPQASSKMERLKMEWFSFSNKRRYDPGGKGFESAARRDRMIAAHFMSMSNSAFWQIECNCQPNPWGVHKNKYDCFNE